MRLLFLILILSALSLQPAVAQFNQKSFNELHALAGTWVMPTKKGALYEIWTKEKDTFMKSKSFRVQGNDTIPQETVELQLVKDKVTYKPTVVGQNNQQPVTFTLTDIKDKVFLFENRAHDFPQRITYSLHSKNKLVVIISGTVPGGTYKEIPFAFTRKK